MNYVKDRRVADQKGEGKEMKIIGMGRDEDEKGRGMGGKEEWG